MMGHVTGRLNPLVGEHLVYLRLGVRQKKEKVVVHKYDASHVSENKRTNVHYD